MPELPHQRELADIQALLHQLAQRVAYLHAQPDGSNSPADTNIIFECGLYIAQLSSQQGILNLVDVDSFDEGEDDMGAFLAGDLVLAPEQLVLPLRLAELLRLAFGAGLGRFMEDTVPVVKAVQRVLELNSVSEVLELQPGLQLSDRRLDLVEVLDQGVG